MFEFPAAPGRSFEELIIMRGLFTNQRFAIAAGQAVSGIAKQAQTLRIISGRVWITVEGISQDYWLFAGDTFTATPGHLTVIEADRADSQIELALPCSESLEPGAQWRRFTQRKLLFPVAINRLARRQREGLTA
jgi:hypothetical protein